ncbi:DUF1178 family protein [Maritimibacter sp. DP1N21-5]|uniref:DUF1178 family protein n=1 Tax=Maritimibacter sp. DP1N21-5 TaxID=2836867 RepID=UPI001C490CF3|nr:DUF1178 family protein [Maritimibacter sp. DP1N21-5]MBV7409329.1 DUF1178 family protein [Maritimibacter sp. DP1N21-5]
MIRYSLKCDRGHDFESWFQSGTAFDGLVGSGHVSCPDCGSTAITKSLMAPRVTTSEAVDKLSEKEKALAKLRAKVEAESDYVGLSFAKEARAMHEGDAPERSIYGEASAKDAIALLEDGIPVAPLPFLPTRKTN